MILSLLRCLLGRLVDNAKVESDSTIMGFLTACSALYMAKRKFAKPKAQMHLKFEHPLRVIKWHFGCIRV